MSIDDLMRRIEETERLIGVYRDANEVMVGTEDEIYSRRGLINRTTLTAAEIGERSSISSSTGLQQCVHSSKTAAAKITGKADDRPCEAGQDLIGQRRPICTQSGRLSREYPNRRLSQHPHSSLPELVNDRLCLHDLALSGHWEAVQWYKK
jgi:hypothetical protein